MINKECKAWWTSSPAASENKVTGHLIMVSSGRSLCIIETLLGKAGSKQISPNNIFVDTKEHQKSCSTHWGRVTHIWVGKQTIIGSDNGLAPGRRQAIFWTNDGILLIRSLGTNFSEILSKNHTFSFKKMLLKMLSAKWRPSWLGLNVLTMLKIMMAGCLMAPSNYPINDDSTAVQSGLHDYTYSQCKWAYCELRSQ